jgi:hypothetical protein
MIYRSCERLGRAVSIQILAAWFLHFLGGRSLSRTPIADVDRKVTLCTSSRIKFFCIYRFIADFIAIIIYKIKDVYLCVTAIIYQQ